MAAATPDRADPAGRTVDILTGYDDKAEQEHRPDDPDQRPFAHELDWKLRQHECCNYAD